MRSEAILSNFSIVAWIGLSQQPQLNKLQHRLFEQITGNSVKDKTQSAELFLEQLIEAAKGQVILLVLDDLCTCVAYSSTQLICFGHALLVCTGDRNHQKPFDCIDTDTSSRLLITTRIRSFASQC